MNRCCSTISKFQKVSRLKMHRDPSREKCKALLVGLHRDFKGWPDWVTVKDKVKIMRFVKAKAQLSLTSNPSLGPCTSQAQHHQGKYQTELNVVLK